MPEIFSPEINWLTPLIEEREYETGIIVSHNGTDQRISYMDVPNRRLTYNISALDEREAALLEALIRRVQGEQCYVPYWRGAAYLTQAPAFAPGALTRLWFDGDPAALGFEEGAYAMVWKNPHEAFVSKISSLTEDGILTDSDLLSSGTWPVRRTKVVPVFLGQLAQETSIDYAAKFAKEVQVIFDLIPHQKEFSADCNWAFVEAVLNPLFVQWSIDPTGGPSGGPALKGILPANSRDVHLVDTGAAGYITILGSKRGTVLDPFNYTLEVKVKTDWDIAAAPVQDGVPFIGLTPTAGGVPGVSIVDATTAAFNAWETVTDTIPNSGEDGVMTAILGITLGTSEEVPYTFWFAEMVIRDEDGNIILTCLPNIPPTEENVTPIFAPLECLHRPGQSMQKVSRAVDRLSSIAGAFSVRPRSDVPYTEHLLELVFFNAEQIYAFKMFFDLVMGAFGAFWVPSYQQDLTPIGTIAADDDTFDIVQCRYTELDFPGTQRRQIAFVQPDGSFIKRSITAAVDNGDDTETLTLNEPLGFSFSQNNANGICFLWYGRFVDDVEKIEWITSDMATMQIAMVEIADPPDGGSGDSSEGFLSDVP